MIVILRGGDSSEREVSIATSNTIIDSLKSLNLDFLAIDTSHKDWLKELKSINPEVVIIALHGTFGEDGQVQKILERNNIKYTGSDSAVAQNCFNKTTTKEAVRKLGIKVPTLYSELLIEEIEYPCVVKPNQQGSSFGVNIVNNLEQLQEATLNAKKYDLNNEILIEELIKGDEVTCAVINVFGKVEALPLVQIIPKNNFFAYKDKYDINSGCEEICPAQIDSQLTKEIQKLSVKIFENLRIKQYCRIDWMIRNGIPYFLEVNTHPGMTPTSLINKELKAREINFDSFISGLITTA